MIVRFGLYLDLMILFGAPLFGIYSPQPADHRRAALHTLRALYAGAALVGLLLSALALAALTASMSGVPLLEVDWSAAAMLVRETSIGWAWLVRIAALGLFIIVVALSHPMRGPSAGLLTLLGGVALATLAWTGHGAMDEGLTGIVHVSADIFHLLAAGAWIAAIFALGTLLVRAHRSMSRDQAEYLHRALARFAAVGSIAVALLIVTGLVNSWVLVGLSGLATIGTNLYLQLLAIKLLLFIGMLALAALNRFRITPALEEALRRGDQTQALRRLRKSLVVEASLGVAILGLVAWLGMLMPPSAVG
ncbi:copper homeostasis membrane protein CopD [Sphingomonas sp. ID1715]|uniref:copper homeostasis membrane protein CopD n=1 Tax=Sphingomonas sp. ID1715 TaxID=1656898 RepID=UPI001487780D|nr:copper homeostasis membrane protein CopD [Sphingomonas sp. ID1715]NNM77786.1 copper homeostasis membrane protein CopD [Sphingomonas sp. ID1715]